MNLKKIFGSSIPKFQMERVRIVKLGLFGIPVENGELCSKEKSVYLLQGKRYTYRKKERLIFPFLS